METATTPRKKVTKSAGPLLPVQGEAAAALILEAAVEVRRQTAVLMEDQREALLTALMEEVLLRRLEGEQEDQLELLEAAVDGEEAPVEAA